MRQELSDWWKREYRMDPITCSRDTNGDMVMSGARTVIQAAALAACLVFFVGEDGDKNNSNGLPGATVSTKK